MVDETTYQHRKSHITSRTTPKTKNRCCFIYIKGASRCHSALAEDCYCSEKNGASITVYDGCVLHSPGVFFQARLLDNQEGANTERHVSAKLSVRCFQRRALWHPTDRDIKKKPPFTPTKKKKGAAHHHQRTQVADSYNCPAAGVPSGTCTI